MVIIVDAERLTQFGKQALGRSPDDALIGDIWQDNDKLVAAEPRHRVPRPYL